MTAAVATMVDSNLAPDVLSDVAAAVLQVLARRAIPVTENADELAAAWYRLADALAAFGVEVDVSDSRAPGEFLACLNWLAKNRQGRASTVSTPSTELPRVVVLLKTNQGPGSRAFSDAILGCSDRGWEVKSTTNSAGAAIALVESGEVDAVVSLVAPTDAVELKLRRAGVDLRVLR